MRLPEDSTAARQLDAALLMQLQSRITLLAVATPAGVADAVGFESLAPPPVADPFAAIHHKALVYLRWCVAGTLTVAEAHSLVVHDLQAARLQADAVIVLETAVNDLLPAR